MKKIKNIDYAAYLKRYGEDKTKTVLLKNLEAWNSEIEALESILEAARRFRSQNTVDFFKAMQDQKAQPSPASAFILGL